MRQILIIGCLLLLSSCSFIKKNPYLNDQNKNYLAAKSIPSLRIPPGVSSKTFANYYPVSDKAYPPPSKAMTLLPPDLN